MLDKKNASQDIDRIIYMLEESSLSADVTCKWTRPARAAQFSDFPDGLETILHEKFNKKFSNGPFKHQSDAIKSIKDGKNVLITTGTSSGKSLCYQLPILDLALKDPSATAILLFPTKALAEDQLKKLGELISSLGKSADGNLIAATYDGDTPKGKRIPIRNNARILLTNPDMLHIGILPQHTHWERFLKNLKFIVIDEVHTYRGVFGSHFANVLRRLKRILKFYGSQPQFILTSATLANAGKFANSLTGEDFVLIDKDTSFQEAHRYFFINPPVVDESLGLRKGMIDQTIEIASALFSYDIQSLLFSRTRKTVEITLKKLKETIEKSDLLLHGYRSGYLPKERRTIEEGLRTGRIRSVISTSALEMGIDMGKVDLTLLMGYPGSISSFYQQSGRAGRRGRNSVSILVASASPMDQYVIRHCEYISEGSPEHALIDPDNSLILLEHIKCASFELPFSKNDSFGNIHGEDLDNYLQVLVLLKLMVERGNRYFWIAEDYPSANISLRNIAGNPIALRLGDELDSHLIGEVDFQSAMRIAHPGAVYMHDGNQYLVNKLDLEENIAWLSPHHDSYYTEHRSETSVSLENTISELEKNNIKKSFAEIRVTERVKGYKRIDWETLLTLGVFDLDGLPQNELHTKGLMLVIPEGVVEKLKNENMWRNNQNDYGNQWPEIRTQILQRDHFTCQICGIGLPAAQLHVHHKIPFRTFDSLEIANHPTNLITLCPNCHRKAEQNVRMRSGLSGVAFLLANLAPLSLLCDHRDIGYFCEAQSDLADGGPVIVVYDQFPGGIGLSAKLYEILEDVLLQSLEVIEQCICEEGCPSCVGPAGENGLGGKELAKEMLKSILY